MENRFAICPVVHTGDYSFFNEQVDMGLPWEMQAAVFSFFTPRSLGALCLVNKAWKVFAEEELKGRYPDAVRKTKRYVDSLSEEWAINGAVHALEKGLFLTEWAENNLHLTVFNWASKNNNTELMVAMAMFKSVHNSIWYALRRHSIVFYHWYLQNPDQHLRFLQTFKGDDEGKEGVLKEMLERAFEHPFRSEYPAKLIQVLQENGWDNAYSFNRKNQEEFWTSSLKKLVKSECPSEVVYPLLNKLEEPFKEKMTCLYNSFLSEPASQGTSSF